MRCLALVCVFAASLLAASADAQWISGGTGAGGGSGTVTQVQTSSPLTGGPFTVSGTVGCATCDNSAATLTNNQVMLGAGTHTTKVDTGCSTDGAGAMTCPSFATNGVATGTVAITNVGGAGNKITLSVNNPGSSYTLKFPDTDSSNLISSNGSGQYSASALTGDVTSSGVSTTIAANAVTAAKSAAVMTARGIVLEVGSPTGSALTTSDAAYVTVPFKCTISASDVMIDVADATVSFDVVRVATGGTALPSASILTGGFLAVASGTAVHNGNTTLFSSTAIAQNDRIGLKVHAANTAKYGSVMIQCNATD